MEFLTILTLPFLGTTLGAAMVFFVRDRISDITNKCMLGFASGIMVAAAFWSLLQPALEQSGGSGIAHTWPVITGFLVGMGFLLALDTFIPHQHVDNEQPEGVRSALPRSVKMMLAVALHNIPEGMAVGVVLAGVSEGNATLTVAAALALSIGMAVQNIPEGAIISMPLHSEGKGRAKAFLMGTLSGLVEPVAAVVTVIFLEDTAAAMPPLLAFAAGAMLYVVIEELIPSSQNGKHSNIGTIGFAFGFALMMLFDATIG